MSVLFLDCVSNCLFSQPAQCLDVLSIEHCALSLSFSHTLAHMHTHACPPSHSSFHPLHPSISPSLFLTLTLHGSLTITAFVLRVLSKIKNRFLLSLSTNNMQLHMHMNNPMMPKPIMKGKHALLLSANTTHRSKEKTVPASTEGSPFSAGQLSSVIEEVDENRSR